jgi:RNA polymerase sigma-70 factor, ECF subfamily
MKGLSSFRAFFFPGIAAHKITEAFWGVGRNGAHSVAEPHDSPIPHDDPERRPLAPGVGERLGQLLHRLTPRQRAVLVLRIAVGMSAEETAQVLGSSPGAVRVTQHRALNRLRGVVSGPLDVAPGHPGDAAPHPADTRPDPLWGSRTRP